MKQAYIIIFVLVATELIGFGLIIPVLPQISTSFTSSGFLIGVLLSSYSLAQFFSAPYLGKLSDRIGRKPVLVLSKCGTIISYILLAHAHNYYLLLISRLLDGFTGGNIAVARAYLSDISSEENRSKAMAIVGMSFAIGFILGPAIGGFCYQAANNFSIAGYVGAGLSLISLIITIFGLKESENKHSCKNPPPILSSIPKLSKQTSLILITYGFIMIVFSGFETSFSVYTNSRFGLSESQNSYLFLLIGVAAFLVQGSLMKLSIQPFKRAALTTLVSIGISLILTNIIPTLWPSLFMLVLLVLGISIANTHFPAELTKLSTDQKGLILGIYESIGSMARIIGPLIMYCLFYQLIEHIYIILGTTTLFYCTVYFVLQKKLESNSK